MDDLTTDGVPSGTYDPLLDSVDVTGIPTDYADSIDMIAPGTATAVAQQQAGSSQPWYDTLMQTIPLLLMTEQQRQLLQVQVDRAKQGLPPLDVSQYGAGVQVGISADTQKMFVWLGIGLAAVAGVALLARSR